MNIITYKGLNIHIDIDAFRFSFKRVVLPTCIRMCTCIHIHVLANYYVSCNYQLLMYNIQVNWMSHDCTCMYVTTVIGCLVVLVLVIMVAVCVFLNTRIGRYIFRRFKTPAEKRYSEKEEEAEEGEERDSVVHVPTRPLEEREGLLHRPSVQRDAEIGEGEVPVEGRMQDVRPLCENISSERYTCMYIVYSMYYLNSSTCSLVSRPIRFPSFSCNIKKLGGAWG